MGYRALIVDDEAIIRRGLRNTIDWHGMGFDEIECAEDGAMALELMESLQPNIVITDIMMPMMDGLEYLRQIQLRNWNTKVIILSGYDSFEFAQKAIRYGAYQYLLKPAENEELEDAIRSALNSSIQSRRAEQPDALQPDDSRILKCMLLRDISDGYYQSEAEAREDMDVYNVVIYRGNHISLAARMDGAHDVSKFQWDELTTLTDDLVSSEWNGYAFRRTQRSLGIVLAIAADSTGKLETQRLSKQVLYLARRIGVAEPSFAVSEAGTGALAIGRQFSQCDELMLRRPYSMSASTLFYGDAERQNADTEYPLAEEHAILSAIAAHDSAQAIKAMSAFINRDLEQHAPASSMRMHAIALLFQLERQLNGRRNDGSRWLDNDTLTQFSTAQDAESLSMLHDLINEMIQSDMIAADATCRPEIERVTEYIQRHYAEPITLGIVAALIHLSPCYLSRMFKHDKGMGFQGYLAQVRIEKAKELMSQGNHHIYEIAHQVGYTDSVHFCKLFKRTIGMTPQDYVRRCRGDGGVDSSLF